MLKQWCYKKWGKLVFESFVNPSFPGGFYVNKFHIWQGQLIHDILQPPFTTPNHCQKKITSYWWAIALQYRKKAKKKHHLRKIKDKHHFGRIKTNSTLERSKIKDVAICTKNCVNTIIFSDIDHCENVNVPIFLFFPIIFQTVLVFQ